MTKERKGPSSDSIIKMAEKIYSEHYSHRNADRVVRDLLYWDFQFDGTNYLYYFDYEQPTSGETAKAYHLYMKRKSEKESRDD